MCGEGEREPPRGAMTTPLMRHQRLALDWMLRREAPRAAPSAASWPTTRRGARACVLPLHPARSRCLPI